MLPPKARQSCFPRTRSAKSSALRITSRCCRYGKVVLSGAVDDLKAGSKIVEGIFASDAIALNGLSSDARITRVERTGRIVRLTVSAGGDALAQQLTRWVRRACASSISISKTSF